MQRNNSYYIKLIEGNVFKVSIPTDIESVEGTIVGTNEGTTKQRQKNRK